WLNPILLPTRADRDAFLQYSNDNGVMTRPVWELMWRLPMFEDCERDSQENTIALADRLVNLPSSVVRSER
ncbi:MAG: aminotransferase DegT, partial [Muribaculaceae bacterium]|nr:aminotransferase DegT [Muribaculaceae bacterium]